MLNSNIELYPHQNKGVDFMYRHHYVICADDMGLGKTLEAIALQCKTKLKTLYVVPAFLRLNWETEINKFTNLKVKVCWNRRDLESTLDGYDAVVIGYSQLKHSINLFSWAEMVVADECHYLCNLTAQRTTMFHEYIEGRKPERLVLLSGTPIKNRVGEYYSLLALCSYNPRGTSGKDLAKTFDNYYKFVGTFCNMKTLRINGRRITKYEGVKNISRLKELLKGKFFRRTTDSVLDLPPLLEQDVFIDKEIKDPEYEEMWEEFKENGISGHFSTVKKRVAIAKALFTANYAANIVSSTGSCIIFTDHPDAAWAISAKLPNSKVIDGSVDPSTRAKLVDQFQRGLVDVLVCTIGAASTGFTLTRASDLVFNDINWVGANNEQAKKRIHRISQEKTCRVHYICGSKVDVKIRATVNKKEKDVKRLL